MLLARFEPLEARRLLAWTPVHTGTPQGPNTGSWTPNPPDDLQDDTATLTFSNLPAHTHIRAGFDIPAYDGDPWNVPDMNVTGQLAGNATTLDYHPWLPGWTGFTGDNTFAHTGSSAQLSLTGEGFDGSNWLWHARYTWVDIFTPGVSISGGGSVDEDGGPVEFTVTRDGDTSVWGQSLVVSLDTSGTATSSDYVGGLPSTIEIPAGAGSATFSLQPVDDDLAEGIHSTQIAIAESSIYDVLGVSGLVEILDDDAQFRPAPASTWDGNPRPDTAQPIQVSAGETVTLHAFGTDEDERSVDGQNWERVPGEGPYEVRMTIAGKAKFPNGQMQNTVDGLSSGNMNVTTDRDWGPDDPDIKVTMTLVDAGERDRKDPNETVTWTLKRRLPPPLL